MMKKGITVLAMIATIWLSMLGFVYADMTIDIKTSLSGIPFITEFEMNQSQLIREGEVAFFTDMEIGLPSETDTSVKTKAMVVMDLPNDRLLSCEWEESKCQDIRIGSLYETIRPEMLQWIMDTLKSYVPMITQYYEITGFSMEVNNELKSISGYDCYQIKYDFGININVPVEQVPGELRVKVDGVSWMTEDIEQYELFSRNWNSMKETYFPEKYHGYIKEAFGLLGIDPELIDKSWALDPAVAVESSVKISVEIWNEGMSMPSMSFNLLANSILQDISYDDIPDEAFMVPSGFEVEVIDASMLKPLLEEKFK
ncbi:MAG: hypothetical protein GF404_05555 [candidate division Zixibacteria bacterium]|nr:hypothetical protein [candidate division Zixibacteria bacterium]